MNVGVCVRVCVQYSIFLSAILIIVLSSWGQVRMSTLLCSSENFHPLKTEQIKVTRKPKKKNKKRFTWGRDFKMNESGPG